MTKKLYKSLKGKEESLNIDMECLGARNTSGDSSRKVPFGEPVANHG